MLLSGWVRIETMDVCIGLDCSLHVRCLGNMALGANRDVCNVASSDCTNSAISASHDAQAFFTEGHTTESV